MALSDRPPRVRPMYPHVHNRGPKAVAVLFGAVALFGLAACASGESLSDRTMTLGPVPEVRLAPRPPIDEQRAQRIKELIASLAGLHKTYFGLSPTLRGTAFAPVAGQSRTDTMLLTNHHIEQSGALRDLVALGPDALPFLLAALDDRTPTGIVVTSDGFIGGMTFADELWLNTAIPAEAAVQASRPVRRAPTSDKHIASYTVTIGDVCLVAIGQIVGRAYSVVRYQPTAIIVINSPTRDKDLRSVVKWTPKFGPGAKVEFASHQEGKRDEEERTKEAQSRVQGQGRVVRHPGAGNGGRDRPSVSVERQHGPEMEAGGPG